MQGVLNYRKDNNMSALSKEFIESLGITISDKNYQHFADHFDETLRSRVIDSIIDNLTDEQLEAFSQLPQENEDELWAWLQTNVPDLSEIIQDEIDILLGELAENSDQINESTS